MAVTFYKALHQTKGKLQPSGLLHSQMAFQPIQPLGSLG